VSLGLVRIPIRAIGICNEIGHDLLLFIAKFDVVVPRHGERSQSIEFLACYQRLLQFKLVALASYVVILASRVDVPIHALAPTWRDFRIVYLVPSQHLV